MTNPRGRPPKKSPTFNRPVKDFAPPSIDAKEPMPNFDLLSAEDKAALLVQAKAAVEKRERLRAMEAYLAAEEDRLERELHPEAQEELQTITLDGLAEYADRIIIDGVHYMWGRTTNPIPKSRCDVLRDIMYRTRKHYADTHRDPQKAFYDAQREISKAGPGYATINGGTGQVMKF